jgi:hypothetical protein
VADNLVVENLADNLAHNLADELLQAPSAQPSGSPEDKCRLALRPASALFKVAICRRRQGAVEDVCDCVCRLSATLRLIKRTR